MSDIEFKVDGLTLRGKLFVTPSERKKPGVLLIHGWESAQDRMFALAELLQTQGFVCMTIDLRGHGTSDGDHTVSSRKEFLDDVLAAYDVLAAHTEVDADSIFAIGSSFGGYLSALMVAERKLKGIVLRVPADYRDEGFATSLYEQRVAWEHSQWKTEPHTKAETAALRAIHAFQGSVLVVESEQDEIVPHETVRSYGNAAAPNRLSYVLMKGAPHSITRHPEFQKEFNDLVLSWIMPLAKV